MVAGKEFCGNEGLNLKQIKEMYAANKRYKFIWAFCGLGTGKYMSIRCAKIFS